MNLPKTKMCTLATDVLFYVVGSFLYAVSVNMFSAPNDIAPGGFTGLATMLNYLFHLPIGTMTFALNLPFLIWGAVELGKKFLIKVLAGTIMTSVMIDLTASFLPVYQGDMMLTCIFGGVLSGTGLGMVYMRGGATGGTDLTATLLAPRLRQISFANIILIQDIIIVALTLPVYGKLESPMYALIFIFVCSKVVDMLMFGIDSGTGKMMFIISQKSAVIKARILKEMDRGVTELKSRGGYSGIEGEVLLCAVRRNEMYKMLDIVKQEDTRAFVIVGDAHEITGEGFREDHMKAQ